VADEITFEVPPELDGARVDKILAVVLDVSRAQARELVDLGVTVNGVIARPGDRAGQGASIVSPGPKPSFELQPEPMEFAVLYEDDAVIVVDKPAGMICHPGSGRNRGTLAGGLLHRYPEIRGVGAIDRWGLVHRLDKDTSGALVVARTVEAFESLSDQLQRRKIERVYTCLVNGVFDSPTGTIEAPIGRDPNRPTRRAVIEGGKNATTHYSVNRDFDEFNCSLLTVRLETGRTHQIRVHLTAIDHQVIGDRVYGAKTTRVSSPRTFLHASHVSFAHPETGEKVDIESPLPGDLQRVLDSLRSESSE
jgi:23S rRNA pseudouridine1911/1915/1917 synthase